VTDPPASALRHPRFRAFFVAASISNAAAWMQLVAVPALLYDLTGQATWLGLSTVATLVPAVILTPWAGVLSDRRNRRHILLVTQTVQMVATFALWALYASGQVTPGAIIATGFVSGLAAGVQTSAWQSFIPSLVPAADVADAVRLNSVQFTVARALGPAAAGVVVAWLGTGAAIFANGATYLLVIGVLLVIRTRPNATSDRTQSSRRALSDGARWVWHHRGVRLAALLALFSATVSQ
jgi:MFS family permease